MGLIGGLSWRYKLYIGPYLRLDGNLIKYLKRRLRNLKASKRERPLAYIYADSTNAGDRVSSLGVQLLCGEPGLELYCARAGLKGTFRQLRELARRRPNAVVVVGGGGLIQETFTGFWEALLDQPLPFILFGIGANEMEGKRRLPDPELIRRVAESAIAIQVRDEYTREVLSRGVDRSIHVGLCPAVNYLRAHNQAFCYQNGTDLFHVFHEVDIRMAGGDNLRITQDVQDVAGDNDLRYSESSHIDRNLKGLLRSYEKARVVVTSRLHGVIFSLGLGIPVVAISTDHKIRNFVESHCPWVPVLKVNFSRSELADSLKKVLHEPRLLESTELLRSNYELMDRFLQRS